MKFLDSLQRPEYVFRPSQIIRRLAFEFRSAQPDYENVLLPWGLPLRIQPGEQIGSAIRRLGVHDLSASECVARLIDPGETAIDAGANVGQMTSLMAMRSGPRGTVIAFEPHPGVFQDLAHNLAMWRNMPGLAPIDARRMALSDHDGTAVLSIPTSFNGNHGIASLESNRDPAREVEKCEVQIARLDTLVTAGRHIGLLKIDVEGHELKVLMGAGRLLATGQLRDIVFEDFDAPPTPAARLLESHGYTVYRIGNSLFGPHLVPAATPIGQGLHDSSNYLATREPQRTAARVAKRGWELFVHQRPIRKEATT